MTADPLQAALAAALDDFQGALLLPAVLVASDLSEHPALAPLRDVLAAAREWHISPEGDTNADTALVGAFIHFDLAHTGPLADCETCRG